MINWKQIIIILFINRCVLIDFYNKNHKELN